MLRNPRWRRVALWTGVALLVSASGLGVAGCALWWSTPRVDWLRARNPETSAFMQRNRDNGVSVTWHWVGLERVSPHLLEAILVAEDIEFFQHEGFSVAEIRAALSAAWRRGTAPRGASTLTQQLAKNLWLSPARTAWRKLREAVLTWKLEHTLGKRRILELYVNLVEFGPGVFGAEAAARRYFGKPALWLTAHEAAQLAAGLSRPAQWNPTSDSEAYRARVALIRSRMERATFLWRHLLPLYPVIPS